MCRRQSTEVKQSDRQKASTLDFQSVHVDRKKGNAAPQVGTNRPGGWSKRERVPLNTEYKGYIKPLRFIGVKHK